MNPYVYQKLVYDKVDVLNAWRKNEQLNKWYWNKASHLQNATSKQIKLRFIPKSIYKCKLQLDKSLKHKKTKLQNCWKNTWLDIYDPKVEKKFLKETQNQRPQRKLIKYLTPKL